MKAFFYAAPLLLALAGPSVQAQASPAALEAAMKQRTAQQQAAQPADPASFGTPDQQRAKETADTVYNTWRLGMIRGNEQAWRSSTTASRQVKVRNLIISQRGEFPRDFFNHQPEPPKLENFRYVGALTACNGRSMAATYVGKLQLGDGKAEENAFVLELVHENGAWKLDQTRFFNLSQLPVVRERLHARDLSVLREQDGFQPYTSLPRTPAACRAPELIGKVFVDCPGRNIRMSINGISEHEFGDERRADVISGGLRRGQNTISYSIRTDEGKPHPAMAIGIFVMPETPGNKPVCVFDHILDAQDAAEGGSITFTIENGHIASMNPKFTGQAPQPHHAVPLRQKPQGNNE